MEQVIPLEDSETHGSHGPSPALREELVALFELQNRSQEPGATQIPFQIFHFPRFEPLGELARQHETVVDHGRYAFEYLSVGGPYVIEARALGFAPERGHPSPPKTKAPQPGRIPLSPCHPCIENHTSLQTSP